MSETSKNRNSAGRTDRAQGKHAGRNAGEPNTRRRKRITIGAIAAGVIVVIVAALAIYLDRVAPFRATVISVNDTEVSMRTFLRRTRIAGGDPIAMLDVLTNEQIVKQVAPNPPYNIEVSEDDVDAYLRGIAAGIQATAEADGATADATITDAQYEEWYRQQVNESLMRESEFREFVGARILAERFSDYLAERVPTVVEQVRVSLAPFGDLDAAQAARDRISAGESYPEVVADASTDPRAQASGGDLGWQARSGLATGLARLVFDRLEVGEISDPYFIDDDVFALVMVTDHATARQVDASTRRRMQGRALDTWLDENEDDHVIEYHGFSGGSYDAATDAWVRWQLGRMGE